MSPNGIYATRASRAWCQLDDAHFDAANRDGGMGTLMFIGGGCLDAPEQLPAGSMRGYGQGRDCYALPAWSARYDEEHELSKEDLARRNALAEQIINEILAEEAANAT